jgi:hypothetical protein
MLFHKGHGYAEPRTEPPGRCLSHYGPEAFPVLALSIRRKEVRMWKVAGSLLGCLLLVSTTVLAAEPGHETRTGAPSQDGGWASPRVTLTSAAVRELAHPAQVEPSRFLRRARQGGSQGSQQRGWIGRHPVLFGALVGAGPGVVFGEYELGRKGDVAHGPDMLIGAGLGAGIGSLIGFVVGLAR